MNYIFEELSEHEFEKFAKDHVQANFFQTVMMGEKFLEDEEEVYYVGLKKLDKIVAASLITTDKGSFRGKKTFEAHKGFLLDYTDEEILSEFTKGIKKFINDKNGFRILIDPYIVNVTRDMNANIINGIDNRLVIDSLLKLGYKKIEEGAQVKWTYCLDINDKSSEELMQEFRASTRNNINKTINKFQLICRDLEYDELSQFKKITQDTCDRRGFLDKSLEYYQSMYKLFKDDVVFKIVELDCEKYISVLESEISGFEVKIKELSDGASNKKKKEQMKKDIENNKKKIEEANVLKKEKGNIVPLAAAMFMLYGSEIIYLFSGSYDEYMSFCGQYRIQWEIIKYAADNKYKRYNFFGIKDVFNPDGKDYGVYEFKKGFGGYVEELIGPFELGVNNTYKLYNLLRSVKRISKR